MFFFPDKSSPSATAAMTRSRLPANLAMTQSFYVSPGGGGGADTDQDLETFCILGEEEGSGMASCPGRTVIAIKMMIVMMI